MASPTTRQENMSLFGHFDDTLRGRGTTEEGRAKSIESAMTLIRAAMMGLSEREPSGGGEG
jgi:hypothetical protein